MTGNTRITFTPQRISGMKSYYYLDYLHREIFLEEEDIQTVRNRRADDACSAIAEKPYVVEQFMADSFRTLKRCGQPPVRFTILKAATMR